MGGQGPRTVTISEKGVFVGNLGAQTLDPRVCLGDLAAERCIGAEASFR